MGGTVRAEYMHPAHDPAEFAEQAAWQQSQGSLNTLGEYTTP